MNIFLKAAAKVFGLMVRQGITNHYYEFLKSKEEYNQNILQCNDANDGMNSFTALLTLIHAKDVEFQNTGHCMMGSFKFERQIYDFTQFYHYMRVVNIVVSVTCKQNPCKMIPFVNEINKIDLMHQIGYEQQDGENYLVVTRPFLISPSKLCNAESFAQGLRDLNTYAHQLAKMEMPEEDFWKQCATIDSVESVQTASDFWLNQDDTVLRKFAKDSKLISAKDNVETHRIPEIWNGAISNHVVAQNLFTKGTINTYPEFPYLSTLQVNFSAKEKNWPNVSEEALMDFCLGWNASYHMAPCKAFYYVDEEGYMNMQLTMICLYGGQTNTRTYADLLCTMEKATFIMVDALRLMSA